MSETIIIVCDSCDNQFEISENFPVSLTCQSCGKFDLVSLNDDLVAAPMKEGNVIDYERTKQFKKDEVFYGRHGDPNGGKCIWVVARAGREISQSILAPSIHPYDESALKKPLLKRKRGKGGFDAI